MQNCSKHLCWILIATASGVLGQTADQPGLKAELTLDGITVTEFGKPLLHYQLRTKSRDGAWPRANYIHPLHDLDGNVITEDFPDDHGHHRGIFWAWHQVWVGEQKIGDPWVCKDFLWDVQSRDIEHGPDGGLRLRANIEWKSSQLTDQAAKMIPIVAERTVVTVHPANAEYQLLDFKIALKALLPNVRIGGSEDVKGYGGFSPRIKLSKNQKFVGSAGDVEPQKTAVKAGPWIDISDENGGVAILSHPSNPGYPEPWILRARRSMQNARYPGAVPVEVLQTAPTVLKYRLVIHRGSAAETKIPELFADFAAHSHP